MFEPIDKWNPPTKPDFIKHFPPPRVFSTRGNFVWWWWMFMFKEDGIRKQIVAYWTTKTYEANVIANSVNWRPAAEISGTPEKFSYNGISSFWFWDGKGFQDILPKTQRFFNNYNNGSVDIKSEDMQLFADKNDFNLRFSRDNEDFDLRINEVSPHPPPVGYKRTLLTKKMGFDTLKIYHVGFKGDLRTNGYKRQIKGSLYMQNICINTPAFPWLWGVFHKDDRSYLTYFSTFISPLMLRRNADCNPHLDNRYKFLNKNLNYTPVGEDTKRFKHVRYKVNRDDKGLPEFMVSGSLGKEQLKVRLRTLAKCTLTLERKKLWHSKFFYNEFPSEVVELEYTDEKGKVHKENGNDWTGNCEYSWGLLLN